MKLFSTKNKKRQSKKYLAEFIDNHVISANDRFWEPLEDDNEIEKPRNHQPVIKDKILELLDTFKKPTKYTDIIQHLSGIFPDTNIDTFMEELDKLQKGSEIEAGLIGGKLYYQKKNRNSI